MPMNVASCSSTYLPTFINPAISSQQYFSRTNHIMVTAILIFLCNQFVIRQIYVLKSALAAEILDIFSNSWVDIRHPTGYIHLSKAYVQTLSHIVPIEQVHLLAAT